MKKAISALLSLILVLSLCACGTPASAPETTAAPTETTSPATTGRQESPEEAKVLKVLAIGNSHAVDATHLLQRVFQAEVPDQEILLGVMYVSGCRIDQHRTFAENDEAAYRYYKNENGKWNAIENCSLKMALQDEQWDIVTLQEMNHIAGVEKFFENDNIPFLQNYVQETLGYKPTFMWHFVWPNPVIPDAESYDDMWIYNLLNPGENSMGSWVEYYKKNFDNDSSVMYSKMSDLVNRYVLGKNYGFDAVIPSATVLMQMQITQGLKEQDVYRDYTHLTDFGRLSAAYTWYATLMGIEQLEQVSVQVIRANMRQNNFQSQGDLEITDPLKESILTAVNYALQNPLTLPKK